MSSSVKIFENSLAVYVPDRDANGRPLNARPVLDLLSDSMAATFGGVQKRCVESVWKNGAGRLLSENTCELMSFFDSRLLANLVAFSMTYAIQLGINLRQEEIAARINDNLILVSSPQVSANQ